MEQYDARVDAFIEKQAEFAKPILEYIRRVVHEASPLIGETIKWGMPFFDYKGPVCHMAAFKQHCAMGFWRSSLILDAYGVLNPSEETAMGSFGRITAIDNLPSKDILIDYIQQGIALNEKGVKAHPKKPAAEKAELVIPEYFTTHLAAYPRAKAVFDGFSYSNKKEYVEWIVEAKTDATRQKRLDTTIEWLTEGKTRMWKYK
ncbi:YdeI/OmpD-associated family protein [Mucilaginibacter sp. SP1R1]|uniref:YdeI/OmpD-associated family protein n=1 Tax=Mucilaginibacter sp. SP1R1 TaxID=2723091 RepID=UPI00160E1A70|nr:YdeI/OmpD-associated family protein [Mucilaginibacter sp. SP1R1]MBB6147699.1 uncharacterized protein YdeI (YjbR/CyaY-like superfamily) [Mucilaginibacter sp. SP1R1]